MSGGFHGPLARATQGSASDEAARAPDPLGPSGKSSLPARERDASLFVLANPLPMVLLPQMPLEACQAAPLPNVCPKAEDWEDRSSLLCLPGAELKSPNRVDRAALVMAPDGLLVVAEDMFCLGGSFVGM